MKPVFNMNWINSAPSVTPNRWSDKVMTKEMTEKQIQKRLLSDLQRPPNFVWTQVSMAWKSAVHELSAINSVRNT